MSKAHQWSIVPAQEMTRPVDSNTVDLWHFDCSPNGINGTKPIDDIYDDSLVLWLEMQNQNSASTYVIDKSRYGNHGKIVGPTIADGRNGKCLTFDGTNDYLDFSAIDFASLTSCSVSFWRKGINTSAWLLFQGQTGNYYIMATNGTGNFYHGNAGSGLTIYKDGVVATAPTADTNWHHYVVTGANLSTWTALKLSNYANFQYNGGLDELRIYNRVLSATEAKALYNKSIYSLRKDGRYGNAIAIEEGTTNLALNPTLATTTGWGLSKSAGSNATLTSDGEWATVNIPQGETGYYYYVYQNISRTTPANTAVTFSVTFKNNTAGTFALRLVMFIGATVPTEPIAQVTLDGSGAPVTFSVTAVHTADTDALRLDILAGSYYGTYGGLSDVSVTFNNAQLEQKPLATSFVNGTRENGKLMYSLQELGISEDNDWTVSSWVYLNDSIINGSGRRMPFALGDYYVDGKASICIGTSSGGDWGCDGRQFRIAAYIDLAGYYSSIVTLTEQDSNGWAHFTLTYNATSDVSTAYIYCENTGNVYTMTLTTTLAGLKNCQYMYLGGYSWQMYAWNSMVDELRIDNVVRTADEIRAWYLSACPFYPHGPEKICL